MVQRVTCSADKISRLTNPQIDYIIEQVNSKITTSRVNEISESGSQRDRVATTSAHDSVPLGPSISEDSDADSDANKSDSDVYFKSDDSDSDDEYDHELHERLQSEEMARLAKLEEKTPTEPKVDDDDFNKILMEIHALAPSAENHDIYFDDPVPATKCCGSTISPVTA
jgi:hypothetical protein